MRLLNRYVLFDLCVSCAFTAVAICFVFFVGTMFRFLYDGVSYTQLLSVLPFAIPYTLPFSIPASLLVATTLVYGRLVADREITAVQAAGIPAPRLFAPALLLGLVASAVVLQLQAEVIPYCHYRKKDLQKEFIEAVLAPFDGEDVHVAFPSFDLFIREKRGYVVRGVEVQYRDLGDNVVVVAEHGRISLDAEHGLLLILLEDVVVTITRYRDDNVQDVKRARFATYTVDYRMTRRRRQRLRYLSNSELYERREQAEARLGLLGSADPGSAAAGPEQASAGPVVAGPSVAAAGGGLVATAVPANGRAQLAPSVAGDDGEAAVELPVAVERTQLEKLIAKIGLELAWRRSLSLASLLFVLVGAPLPLVMAHPNRLVPFFVGSVTVAACYFGPFLVGKTLAREHIELAQVLWWSGCGVTALIGAVLMIKTLRR